MWFWKNLFRGVECLALVWLVVMLIYRWQLYHAGVASETFLSLTFWTVFWCVIATGYVALQSDCGPARIMQATDYVVRWPINYVIRRLYEYTDD
jgi:hypothetical protein